MTDATHACPGYTCERPECVRRQRDELYAALRRLLDASGDHIFPALESDYAARVWTAARLLVDRGKAA